MLEYWYIERAPFLPHNKVIKVVAYERHFIFRRLILINHIIIAVSTRHGHEHAFKRIKIESTSVLTIFWSNQLLRNYRKREIEKDIYKNNTLQWRDDILGYPSTVIAGVFREANSFRKSSSRKPGSFEEQIISKDKYPNMFSAEWRLFCLYFKPFLQYAQFWKLGKITRMLPSFSCREKFRQVKREDQSGACWDPDRDKNSLV